MSWIDGICINQTDLQQRSAQVQLVRGIYSKCEGVIAWLGDEDDDNLAVITALGVLANLHCRFDQDGIPDIFNYEGTTERLPMSALIDFLSRPLVLTSLQAIRDESLFTCTGLAISNSRFIGLSVLSHPKMCKGQKIVVSSQSPDVEFHLGYEHFLFGFVIFFEI